MITISFLRSEKLVFLGKVLLRLGILRNLMSMHFSNGPKELSMVQQTDFNSSNINLSFEV